MAELFVLQGIVDDQIAIDSGHGDFLLRWVPAELVNDLLLLLRLNRVEVSVVDTKQLH